MLYRGPASLLAVQALSGALVPEIERQAAGLHGHKPGRAEAGMWERGLPAVLSILLEAGLSGVEVLVEFSLPLTRRSADIVLAGVHPVTGDPSYVVVEVKLWSEAVPDGGSGHLWRIAGRELPVLSPVEQVRGYCEYLRSFNGMLVDHPDRISGVAFLPNAENLEVQEFCAVEPGDQVPMYAGDSRMGFISFLQSRLAPAGGAEQADLLLSAKSEPAPRLMALAGAAVREREQFVLLDEQKVAFEEVLEAVRQAGRAGRKEGVLVVGGPGTGKSVIALSLLGQLYREGRTVMHATGSRAFTTTLRKLAGARNGAVKDLFRYFNSFAVAERDSLDVLICDEAHSLRATSANRYTPQAMRTGRSQIEELIDVARVPVFLLDEHQVVRPGEIGTVSSITRAAEELGVGLRVVELDQPFRVGGSDVYLQWVSRLLGTIAGGPVPWEPDGKVVLKVVDSPQELEDFLDMRRAEGDSARITAGYCWEWTKRHGAGESLPLDVRIGDWARPWSVAGDRSVAGAPPASLWAIDPAGYGQIGSVYTAQGFEFDWSGVILGPDLVWRSDRWVCDRSSSKDPVFKKSISDEDVDRLIRNSYKVLLTRGLVGTVVYSTDPETRAKLRNLVSGQMMP